MNTETIANKEFNDTGLCVPHLHYMSDRSAKVRELVALVEKGKYFTIHLPRQYGKTTVLALLEKELEKMEYLVIRISFEGVGDKVFSSEEQFAPAFLKMLRQTVRQKNKKLSGYLLKQTGKTASLHDLSDVITEMMEIVDRRVVLQIDEVDKSSNNQLFISFLGMLRAKYLLQNEGTDSTFFSVLLAGVHDVKNLKVKIRPGDEQKYNSPWNIAVDLDVDFSLSPDEIADMLTTYTRERRVAVDIPFFSGQLFYYTSGYPFLVSYLCKLIDEKILPGRKEKEWKPGDLVLAVQAAMTRDNTNFQSLIKNLANNPDLYEFVFKIVMSEQEFSYNAQNEIIRFGFMYGILGKEGGKVKIHNRLYEQLIYNYMASTLETSGDVRFDSPGSRFINKDGSLNIEGMIRKFQEFMKEQYSRKDIAFIERNGRLLFLAFLRPVINGKGFDFKEVQVSEEKRLDVVITFGGKKYIIELKKWYGEKAHRGGLKQLADYLERQGQDEGYLIIFDTRLKSHKIGKSEVETLNSRRIFTVWV
jgi:hypothetical protein